MSHNLLPVFDTGSALEITIVGPDATTTVVNTTATVEGALALRSRKH